MAPVAPVSSAPLLPSFSLGSTSLVAPSLPFAAQFLPYFFLCLLVSWCFGWPFRCFSSSSEPAPPSSVPLLPLPRLVSSFSFCFWPFLAPSPSGPAVSVVTSLLTVWPFLLCLTLFMAWLGFLVCALLMLTIALSLCWLLVVLPPLPFLIVCLDVLFMGIYLLLLLFLSSFLPSFFPCLRACDCLPWLR